MISASFCGAERMPSRTLSDKLRKVYAEIEEWRKRPLKSECPYGFADGVRHKRSWGGHVENVGVLVAIGVDRDSPHREVIAVDEDMQENAAGWEQFFRRMIERGLKDVGLVVGDQCAGLAVTVNTMLPQAKYQRCMVHFNAQRALQGAVKPPGAGVGRIEDRLRAGIARSGSGQGQDRDRRDGSREETEGRRQLSQGGHWRDDDLPAGRVLREPPNQAAREQYDRAIEQGVRRRTRVVGGFPDSSSALMLICARIRYVTAN